MSESHVKEVSFINSWKQLEDEIYPPRGHLLASGHMIAKNRIAESKIAEFMMTQVKNVMHMVFLCLTIKPITRAAKPYERKFIRKTVSRDTLYSHPPNDNFEEVKQKALVEWIWKRLPSVS